MCSCSTHSPMPFAVFIFYFFGKDSSVMVLEAIGHEEGGKREMEGEIIIDVTGTAVLLGTKGSKCCF